MNLFDYMASERERRDRMLRRAAQTGSKPKVLLTVGGLAAGIAGVVLVTLFFKDERTEESGHMWWKDSTTTEVPLDTRLTYLFIGICLLVVAALCVVVPISLARRRRSLKKYLAILTGVEHLRVQQIADITGLTKSRVFGDLQTMIDSGAIDDFYIDYQSEQIVSKKYVPKNSHKTVVTCSGCGGHNDLIVGITKPCSFCGEPLLLSTF